MKKIMLAVFVCLFSSSALASTGPEIFKQEGCDKCHSIKKEQIKKLDPEEKEAKDLSVVGKDHDKKWIAGWLLKKVELDGEKHKKSFQGKVEDLKALATWLETLR